MICVSGLKKVFNPGSAVEKVAISNVSLDVAEGEFVAVIGGNGAGKSTFLNLLGGAVLPDEGRIEIQGTEVTRLPEHKRASFISRVFQDPMQGTAPSLSIEENMVLALLRSEGRGVRSASSAKRRELFKERLSELKLGLENRLSAPAGSLSGGQRQALALAMATLVPPKLLLLDEHTAALDPGTSRLVMDATVSVVTTHRLTTLMVTHNMEHAIACASRIIMMDAGTSIADIGRPEKDTLTVADLIQRFQIADDRIALNRTAR